MKRKLADFREFSQILFRENFCYCENFHVSESFREIFEEAFYQNYHFRENCRYFRNFS
jgi:hypothetical protein